MALAEACRQGFYSSPDVFENSLVDSRVRTVRIVDVPVFNLVPLGAREGAFPGVTAHVDDEVGSGPIIVEDSFGGKPVGWIAVGLESCEREFLNNAERRETGAGGFEKAGGITTGDGFRHRTAARIADTNE
jgi:hypothetical protein